MESLDLITVLEGDLKAFVSLSKVNNDENDWLLKIRLFFEEEPVGFTSFNLNGYSQEEAERIARNIKKNEFMMKEIDEFLWGESD